jgi:hypothetical protein
LTNCPENDPANTSEHDSSGGEDNSLRNVNRDDKI